MNKYRIKIDDSIYEMEVELVGADNTSIQAPAAVKAAANHPPVVKPAPAVKPSAPSGAGKKVNSPMPGMIIKTHYNVGDAVQAGQPVVVLEAMKMENEINAPKSGHLLQLAVKEGQVVSSGDFLFEIG